MKKLTKRFKYEKIKYILNLNIGVIPIINHFKNTFKTIINYVLSFHLKINNFFKVYK